MKNIKLPFLLKPFFWDTNFSSLSFENDQCFIIARILEKGDDRAIRWLTKTISPSLIKKSLTSQTISPKTKRFWALRYA